MVQALSNNMTMAHLAVEYWKLLKAFERAIGRLPHEHVAKTTAKMRFSAGKLDALLKEAELNLIVFDGKRFEPNIPATALNVDDFTDSDNLTIESTIEPAVVENTKVLLFGKVVVKKVESGGRDVSGN